MELVQKYPFDVISVDSAMVYRGMDIGTAKPSLEELKHAPHRLIDICDPKDAYSAGQFCADAIKEIKKIHSENRTPLLVGGTMLYFHKLLFGLADLPIASEKIRQVLTEEAKVIGWEAMHQRLALIDPEASQKIKPQDPQRIQRALEVFLLSGKTITEFQKQKQDSFLKEYEVISIALIPDDRTWLHHNIENRFKKMLADGLIDEVKQFYNRPDMHPELPSMRIVGYRQIWEYLEGKIDFDTMEAKAIAATRQLAKRQLTWLRSWKNLTVFDPRDPQLFEKVIKTIS